MVSTLEQDCLYNHFKQIQEYMTNVIGSHKQKLMNKYPNIQKGTNISSHLPLCKTKKCRYIGK